MQIIPLHPTFLGGRVGCKECHYTATTASPKFPCAKQSTKNKKKHRSPILDGAEGKAAGSAATADLPHTECESLKACVPHQQLGLLPKPLMRLDLNYDREGRG